MERIFIISSQRENRQCLQLYHVMNSSNNPGPHKLENNYTKMLHPADAGCSCPASICFCLFPLVKTITKTGRHYVPPLQHSPYLHFNNTKNLNLLSHPKASLAPQARVIGENLSYVTLAPQARPSSEIFNQALSC